MCVDFYRKLTFEIEFTVGYTCGIGRYKNSASFYKYKRATTQGTILLGINLPSITGQRADSILIPVVVVVTDLVAAKQSYSAKASAISPDS